MRTISNFPWVKKIGCSILARSNLHKCQMGQIEDFFLGRTSSLALAIAAAKKRISPRTGFVHLYTGDSAAVDTIAVYENVCFVLALCRQKEAESIAEAKDLLQRILPFQTEEGNFPLYLHEYPKASTVSLALQIAPVLVRILQEFGAVLGAECRAQLQSAMTKIIRFISQTYDEAEKRSSLWKWRKEAILRLANNQPIEKKRV